VAKTMLWHAQPGRRRLHHHFPGSPHVALGVVGETPSTSASVFDTRTGAAKEYDGRKSEPAQPASLLLNRQPQGAGRSELADPPRWRGARARAAGPTRLGLSTARGSVGGALPGIPRSSTLPNSGIHRHHAGKRPLGPVGHGPPETRPDGVMEQVGGALGWAEGGRHFAAIRCRWFGSRSVEPRESSRQAGPWGALLQGQAEACLPVGSALRPSLRAEEHHCRAWLERRGPWQRHDFAVRTGHSSAGPLLRPIMAGSSQMGGRGRLASWAFGRGTLRGGQLFLPSRKRIRARVELLEPCKWSRLLGSWRPPRFLANGEPTRIQCFRVQVHSGEAIRRSRGHTRKPRSQQERFGRWPPGTSSCEAWNR